MLPNCARSLFSNVFGLSWLGFWSRLGFSRYTPLSAFLCSSLLSSFPLSLSLLLLPCLSSWQQFVESSNSSSRQAVLAIFGVLFACQKAAQHTHTHSHTHAAKWKSDSALCFSFFAFFTSARNLLWGCLMHESKWKMNLIHLQTTVRVIARWFTKWPTQAHTYTIPHSLPLPLSLSQSLFYSHSTISTA